MDTDAESEAPASAKTTPAQTKPANVQKAVMSQAFQAARDTIKTANTLEYLSKLSKRVAERFEQKDLSQKEYDDLVKLLVHKETELKP